MLQQANSFWLRRNLKTRRVTTKRAMLRTKKPWMKKLSLKIPPRSRSTPHPKIQLLPAKLLETPLLMPPKAVRLRKLLSGVSKH
jgi:hypothetical protein